MLVSDALNGSCLTSGWSSYLCRKHALQLSGGMGTLGANADFRDLYYPKLSDEIAE